MTKQEAIEILTEMRDWNDYINQSDALQMAIDALTGWETEPLDEDIEYMLNNLPSVSTEKTGRCKDCKWWRDSDGAYRRGVKAESRCPINTVSVANGVGYCYMFEPKMGVEE